MNVQPLAVAVLDATYGEKLICQVVDARRGYVLGFDIQAVQHIRSTHAHGNDPIFLHTKLHIRRSAQHGKRLEISLTEDSVGPVSMSKARARIYGSRNLINVFDSFM